MKPLRRRLPDVGLRFGVVTPLTQFILLHPFLKA